MTLHNFATLSDLRLAAPEGAYVQVGAAILDHLFDHHWLQFGVVHSGPGWFRMPPELDKHTLANPREPAAVAWGSKGRRYKSRQPDRAKVQFSGGSAERLGPPLA